MQVLATNNSWYKLSLILWAGFAGAADPVPTVLVTDFQTPPGAEWAWARRGLPELAVEALGERDVATVDRDLLSVLKSEQDLAAGRDSAKGGLQMGQWLGATYLLAGSVETVTVSRVRLTGSLTHVETAEQIGVCAIEGDYKKELQALVSRWVVGLMKNAELGKPPEAPEKANPVKPEALMLFQQGMDACAAGQPALAVGFFLNAHTMDPRLRAAKEWEAHAYELGGLPRYAAAVRAHITNTGTSSVASASASTQSVLWVVNVLTPVWLGGTNAVMVPTMPTLKQAVEEAVLSSKNIRLYHPESLVEAVTESDRQLGLQFSSRSTSRYARWLVSDAALYSTMGLSVGGRIRIEVGLIDALTARRLNQVKREVAQGQVKDMLADAIRECLEVSRTGVKESPARIERSECAPVTAADLAQLPDFRIFTRALDARMRGVETVSAGQALTDFYARTGLAELAAIELDLVLRKAEARGPDMDAVLLAAYWWGKCYWYSSPFGDSDALMLADESLFSRASYDQTNENVRARIVALRDRLMNEYPASMGAYAIHHREAMETLHAEQWDRCVTHSEAAWQALEAAVRTGQGGRVAIGTYLKKEETTRVLIHINCLYLQSVARRHLGEYGKARSNLAAIQDILDQDMSIHPLNFINPGVNYDDDRATVAFGQYGETGYLTSAIAREREELAADEANQQCLQAIASRNGTLSTRVQQLAKREARTPAEYLAFLKDVAQVWSELPPVPHARCLLAEQAIKAIAGMRSLPASERRAAAQAFARAYLKATGVNPDQLASHRSLEVSVPRLKFIIRSYRSMGLGVGSLDWVNQWLNEPADPAFSQELVDQLVNDLSGCIRLPIVHQSESILARMIQKNGHWTDRVLMISVAVSFNERVIGELVDGIIAVRESYRQLQEDLALEPGESDRSDRPDVNEEMQAAKAFFEQHKRVPGIQQAQSRFWRTLSKRAALYGAYRFWHHARRLEQACSSATVPSPNTEDHFVARLAIETPEKEVLCEALRLREELGPSLEPVPPLSWYAAGYLCISEGAYKQALKAFQLFRKTYNEAQIGNESWLLDNVDSDSSIQWSLDYFEGLALAATGQEAQAAQLFRKLSLRFGARKVILWTLADGEPGESFDRRPIGLLAAEALQKIHATKTSEK